MESIEIVVTTATDEAEEEYKKQPGTIHCPVCLEPTPPHPTPVCPQHSIFCTECLKTYMTLHVSENNVPLVCLDPECNNPIDNHHVQRLTSPNMYKKYQKFLQLKRDPSLKECTSCEHLNIAPGTTTTMTCALCSHCWCSEHGDLHPNKTCKQYLEEMAPSIKQELLIPNKQYKTLQNHVQIAMCPFSKVVVATTSCVLRATRIFVSSVGQICT